MEFEDMQMIWNSEKQEKMFVIDEAALFKMVKQKSGSINRSLQIFEWLMVIVNLVVGVFLLVDGVLDAEAAYEFLLPLMYLGYAIYMFIRRRNRQQTQKDFAETMLGEVDKAIWQLDYLIAQTKSIAFWYLVPLTVVGVAVILLNSQILWAIGVLCLTVLASYFGTRWEIERCYMPKKRELESLRQTIAMDV